ncbi:MAG: phospholipase D family protein [Parahaliea sp.]
MFASMVVFSSSVVIARAAVLLCFSLVGACAGLPSPSAYDKPVSEVATDTATTRLGRMMKRDFSGLGKDGQSGFFPLEDGMDAFVARMALVARADRSLDVQYYIWHVDTSGTLLADALLKAADRGVRVRLLLDDLDTEGKDAILARFEAHQNIEVRVYNPFGYRGSRSLGFVGDLRRLNHRMHNKSLTADNLVTVIGGRNIGDEYFDAASHTTFQDLDVLGIGPVVPKVSAMFDQYWNSQLAIPISAFVDSSETGRERLRLARQRLEGKVVTYMQSDYVRAIAERHELEHLRLGSLPLLWGNATLVYDDPNKVYSRDITAQTHLAPQLAPVLSGASSEVLVVSPYFVPGDILVAFFRQLVARGVRVRILTNSLAANDVGLVHSGYMRYRKDLLRAGVELYEFKPDPARNNRNKSWLGSSSASLHAKTMGSDGERLFVGSFNLDPRSVALNTEMGVVIENRPLAQKLQKAFEHTVARRAYRVQLVDTDLHWSDPVSDHGVAAYDHEPQTSWWQRFAATTLSLIVPERLL